MVVNIVPTGCIITDIVLYYCFSKKMEILKKTSWLLRLATLLLVSNFPQPSLCQETSWELGPFVKQDDVNPIMGPINETRFFCPVRGEVVFWERKDIFNPGTVMMDGRVHMVYRAEDDVGLYNGTSRIGLARSDDGINFMRSLQPVFYPDNDEFAIYEWEGGVEDPRIVQYNGTYVMTYTGYDGELARLMVATSTNLTDWTKHGSVFAQFDGGKFVDLWSKAGSIVTHVVDDGNLEAAQINGKFWMYWGETSVFIATSDDLVNWTPLTDDENGTEHPFNLTSLFDPRLNKFDSDIVEPGPPSVITNDGIVLIYNSRNLDPEDGGDPTLPVRTYTAGQVLINATNPTQVLDRLENYFFAPEKDYEIIGQVGNVVFLQGLVPFNSTWFLYYGTADSKIAVAKTE